jgi:hypothetical protein
MGLNKSQQTNNSVYVFRGKIIKPTSEKSSTTIEKNGKLYETFDSLEGRITGVDVVDGYEGSKDLVVSITDSDNETFNLQFGVNSGYFRSFSRMFPNVDTFKNLEIFCTYKEEENKSKSGIVIKQDGEWIKRFYTYENMGDCPVAIPVEVNGLTTYDYTAQNDFLISAIKAKFESEKLPF